MRQRGLKKFTRTLRRVKNNSRSLNNANFATINTQNNTCNLSVISVNNSNSESETRSQSNPCNLSSIFTNDINRQSETLVENVTIFHSTRKEKKFNCAKEKW